MITLNSLCLIACICGAITDTIAAFLLQQINFQHCSYTKDSLVSPCDNTECSAHQFPPNTCFCCHVMEGIQSECEVTPFTGKQYYYSKVGSCMEIAGGLRIKLALLTVLHLINAVVCIVGICKTSPIMKPVKDGVTFSLLSSKVNKENHGKEQIAKDLKGPPPSSGEEELLVDERVDEERAKELLNTVSDDSIL